MRKIKNLKWLIPMYGILCYSWSNRVYQLRFVGLVKKSNKFVIIWSVYHILTTICIMSFYLFHY